MTSCCAHPEAEAITFIVRQAESRQTVCILAVNHIRKTSHAEDTVIATGRVPAILSTPCYHVLRARNDEVVSRRVMPEQPVANSRDGSIVPSPLQRRERLQHHDIFNLPVRAQTTSRGTVHDPRRSAVYMHPVKRSQSTWNELLSEMSTEWTLTKQ